MDELNYLQGGLLALEGMQPPMRHTPAGPQTWLTFIYGGTDALLHIGDNTAPGPMRALGVLEGSLFRLYHDSDALRQFHLWTTNLIVGLIIVVLFRHGMRCAGAAGGILCAGLLIALPIGAMYGVMSHPYSLAWALGALALVTAGSKSKTNHTVILVGVIWGIAMACRLEMVVLAPILILEATEGEPPRQWLVKGVRLVMAAVLSFVLAAPWFVAGLMGGLRNLAAVGIFHSGNSSSAPLVRSIGFILEQGWLLPLVSAVVFAALAMRENWRSRLYGAAILFMVLVILFAPPRESRYAVPLLLTLVSACLRLVARASSKVQPILCAVLLVGPCWMTIRTAHLIHVNRVADFSTDWIENHVSAGSPVFTKATFYNPLPTPDSAARLWGEVRATDAWQQKFAESAKRYGISAEAYPRAFTEEPMNLEIGSRRRWFLLGAQRDPGVPRYDIHVADSIVFGPQDLVAAFLATGGTLVIRGEELPDFKLGKPVAGWRAASGTGIFIYRR